MPDFERIHRSMNLHLTKTFEPGRVDIVKAFYNGEDHARKQIVYLVLSIAILLHLMCFVIGYWDGANQESR